MKSTRVHGYWITPYKIWLTLFVSLAVLPNFHPANSQDKRTLTPPMPNTARRSSKDTAMQLRAELERMEKEIQNLKTKLPQLRKEVDELVRTADSLQQQQPAKDVPPEKRKPETHKFRPPRLRATTKAPKVAFICQDGRISIFDPPDGSITITVAGRMKMERGDFDLDVTGVAPFLSVDLVRKPGRPGESLDNILRADSNFQRTVQRFSPTEFYLQFAVYPDSFEVFRKARAITWEKQFNANWLFLKVGEKVSVGGGAGSTQ